MNLEEQQYLDLLVDIKNSGYKKEVFSENNTIGVIYKELGTKQFKWKEIEVKDLYILSLYGKQLRFNLEDNKIPLLTSKYTYYPGGFKELLWFIEASADVAKLHNWNCPFWNPWAYKYYLKTNKYISYEEFLNTILAKNNSYKIPIAYTDAYDWNNRIDQSKWAIDQIKKYPYRKSYVISSWNPERIYHMAIEESVVLPSCHNFYQLLVNDNYLTMILTIRSQDLPIGSPINIAQYSLLTYMYAKCTNTKPKELIINLGDVHIYSNELEGIEQQLSNPTHKFPTLELLDRDQQYLQDFKYSDFTIKNYESEENISFELNVVGGFK